TPIWNAGLVPSPNFDNTVAPRESRLGPQSRRTYGPGGWAGGGSNAWGAWIGDPAPARVEQTPPYLKALRQFQAGSVLSGIALPAFDAPPGFLVRLGARQSDPFLSGSFPVGQHTVGFIRLPNMGALDSPSAPRQLAEEVAFFQA